MEDDRDTEDWPFTEEADGTVWLNRINAPPMKVFDRNRTNAPPVKVSDREMHEGEQLVDWPFTEEADGTVWLDRPNAPPVKVLDRKLREGENLGLDADGTVWLTSADWRTLALMRVGPDGPPTDVLLFLSPERAEYLQCHYGLKEVGQPPELDPDPPEIEDFAVNHPDPDAVYEPRADLRGLVTLDELASMPKPDWLIQDLLTEG
jgi:hypothetical protein